MSEGTPTEAEELARLIAITEQRHWSRLGEHDATAVAEQVAELAGREMARLRAEVERLTEQSKQTAAVIDGLAGDVERLATQLTKTRAQLPPDAIGRAPLGELPYLVKTLRERAEVAEHGLHERQRECADRRARDGRQRFGDDHAFDKRARKIATEQGWSCFDTSESDD